MRPAARAGRRVLALLVLAVLGVLAWASPASAHASLERTEPAVDSILPVAPTRVLLHFGEDVGTELGAVKVIGPHGDRADAGRVQGHGRDVVVPLKAGLEQGTYVVAWRVTSADSHPVSGGFSFSIGHTSAAVTTGTDASTPPLTARLMTSARFISFTGLMLMIGAIVVVAVCWPAGAGEARVRRIALIAWALALGGSGLTFLLQGPSSAALGPWAAIGEPRLLWDVVHTRFGQAHVSRLALLLAAGPLIPLTLAARARTSRVAGGTLAAGLVALTGTYALSGHAAVKSPLALSMGIDLTHLLAVGTWAGGLVVVLAALLRSRDNAAALRVWSKLAFACVVVLTATGTIAGFREIGSWAALWHTTYGHLLTAKTLLVAVMVAIGGLSRWLLQRRDLTMLGVTVRREAALGVGVLALTSVLVATVPASASYVKPFRQVKAAGPVSVELDVEPARTGTDAMHIYVTDGKGKAVPVEQTTARVTLSSRGLGPIDVPLRERGPGHAETLQLRLPYAGNWTVDINVRVSDIDSYPVSFTVPVK